MGDHLLPGRKRTCFKRDTFFERSGPIPAREAELEVSWVWRIPVARPGFEMSAAQLLGGNVERDTSVAASPVAATPAVGACQAHIEQNLSGQRQRVGSVTELTH